MITGHANEVPSIWGMLKSILLTLSRLQPVLLPEARISSVRDGSLHHSM
jgi:hypothetical protein